MRNKIELRPFDLSPAALQAKSSGQQARSVYSHPIQPESPLRQRRRARTMARQSPQKETMRKTFKEIQQEISNTYLKIHNMVDHMEEILDEKLQIQQMELLKVFKYTMEKITVEMQNIAQHYNKVIEEVNLSTQLVDLENELEFFRHQALVLFQQNKAQKLEIKRLKAQLFETKDESSIKDSAVLDLTKKIFRLRRSTKRAILTLQTEPNIESDVKISLTNFAKSTLPANKQTRYNSSTRYEAVDTSWNKF